MIGPVTPLEKLGGPLHYRCFHCKQVFMDDGLAHQHFGDKVTDLPLCIQYARSGAGGGPHDPYIRLRLSFLSELDEALVDIGQLIEGWFTTTPEKEWSAWDEGIRQKRQEIHQKVYEALRSGFLQESRS